MSHLTLGYSFDQQLNQYSIPVNLIQLNIESEKYVEIDNEILDRIELEINYHHQNIHYHKSRIINLFTYDHNKQIPRTDINPDKYIVKDEWNDHINDYPVTKIKLIPKIIIQSRIKSAKKLTD